VQLFSKPSIAGFARSPGLWLTLFAAAAYCSLAVPHWRPTWDSAIYISLARAIARGEGYVYMGYADAHYPPGLPLLLSPTVLFSGDNVGLMRLLMAACAAGSVGMTYRLFRRFADAGVSLSVSIMTGASWALFSAATFVLSDIPYLFLSLVALDRIECCVRKCSRRNLLLMAAAVAAAVGMRTVGVTLAAAGAAVILFEHKAASPGKRLRPVGILIGVVALFGVGAIAHGALSGPPMPGEMRESAGYFKEVLSSDPDNPRAAPVDGHGLLERGMQNACNYGHMASDLLSGRAAPAAGFGVVLCGLCMAGWLAACARGASLLEWYSAFSVGACLLWNAQPAPTYDTMRYLLPLLPFLFYYTLQPVLWIGAMLARHLPGGRDSAGRTAAALACVALVLALNVPEDIARVRSEHRSPYYAGAVADYLDAVRWISGQTPKDSVVITDRAPYVWYLAERRAFSGPWLADPREAFDSWTRNRVSHVITGELDHARRFINPVVAAFPEHFRLVRRFGGNALYEKRP